MNTLFTKLSRKLTPILLFPVFATALTGVILSISTQFFTLPEIINNFFVSIHKGQFLGAKLANLYVLMVALISFLICLINLIDRENNSLYQQKVVKSLGIFYRPVMLMLLIPLALCVETGVAYQLGQDWFGISTEQTTNFLNIHRGNFLNRFLGLGYLLISGFSLIALAIMTYKRVTISVSQRQQTKQTEEFLSKSSSKKLESVSRRDDDFSLDEIIELKKKIKLGIIIFSLVLTGILYLATNELLSSLIIIVSVFLFPAFFIEAKLTQIWQHQKEIQARINEQETESITMLKAIPDSMLLVSKSGICLSYMPAKEAKLFLLDGDIINRHLNEFLAPEIANQFIKLAQVSLEKGSTRFCRFPIHLNNIQQYYEARISPIGQTEVLIMVRDIASLENIVANSKQTSSSDLRKHRLLSESELVLLLETVLQENKNNHILFCLGIESKKTNNNEVVNIDDNLIYRVVERVASCLNFEAVARLSQNEVIILIKDCSSDNISELVDDLHNSLNNFIAKEENELAKIKFNLGLLEINEDSPDAVSLINVAKTTFAMAKQKVNLKTFW